MRRNHFPSSADLLDGWVEATGECLKEVRHRVRQLRNSDILPDFRVGASRMTEQHIVAFILAMMAGDDHVRAPDAATARGALPRGKVTTASSVAMWAPPGNLQTDLEFLLVQAKDIRNDWLVCTVEVSTTHDYAKLTLFHMASKSAVHVHYGERPLLSQYAVRPMRRTNLLEGVVFAHMAKILIAAT
jgi:hypothetical protein